MFPCIPIQKMTNSTDNVSAVQLFAALQRLALLMGQAENKWRFAHAALKLDERIQCDIRQTTGYAVPKDFLESDHYRETFDDIYKKLLTLSLMEFLRNFAPDFAAQYGKTFDILNDITDDVVTQCQLLLEAKAENPVCPVPALSKERWEELIHAVNYHELSYLSRHLKASVEAHNIFKKYNCPAEYEIQVYQLVRKYVMKGKWRGRSRKWKEEITNPASYIRKANGRKPGFDFLLMDEAINEAAEQISRIEKPTDFLEAVLVNEENDDGKIECGFVRSRFCDWLRCEDEALIINPSIDFLLMYPEQHLERTTFCVPYKSMAEVLSCQFPSRFIPYEELDASVTYTKVLFFARELGAQTLDKLLPLAAACLRKKGDFHALIPANWVTKKMPGSLAVEKIRLLPRKAICSAPRRKVYVEAVHEEECRESILLCYYAFASHGDVPCLKMAAESPLELPRDDLDNGQTIFRQYRILRSAPSEVKRRSPTAYRFSAEIEWWFNVWPSPSTRGDLAEAYVCHFPNDEQKKRGKHIRGRKIPGTDVSISTCDSMYDIYSWLEHTFPYKPQIHRAVCEEFRKNNQTLRTGTAELKSLWYLQLDIKEGKTFEPDPMEVKLLASSVGQLPMGTEQAELERVMSDYCAEKPLEEQAQLWEILRRVLAFAVKEGYLENNSAREMAESLREKRDYALIHVRGALVKKTFHLEEEQKLLAFLLNKIQTVPEYLAVMIRFFTGLEPGVISALCWGDIHKIGDGSFQFWVYRQCRGNDDEPLPLDCEEDYRRVPLSETLYAALKKRRRDIMDRFPMEEKELRKLRIVVSDEKLRCKDKKNVSPRKINDLSRQAVQFIGIPPNTIELPDMDGGRQTTNLSDYRGDIFRSNFWYHANSVCGFTEAEIRYVLGLRQKLAFDRNYCDYANTYVQLKMAEKLRRWDSVLRSAKNTPARQTKKFVPGRTLSGGVGDDRACVLATIKLGNPGRPLNIHIKCAHGVAVKSSAQPLLPKGKKEEVL